MKFHNIEGCSLAPPQRLEVQRTVERVIPENEQIARRATHVRHAAAASLQQAGGPPCPRREPRRAAKVLQLASPIRAALTPRAWPWAGGQQLPTRAACPSGGSWASPRGAPARAGVETLCEQVPRPQLRQRGRRCCHLPLLPLLLFCFCSAAAQLCIPKESRNPTDLDSLGKGIIGGPGSPMPTAPFITATASVRNRTQQSLIHIKLNQP